MEKIWVKELRMFVSDEQKLIDLGYKDGKPTVREQYIGFRKVSEPLTNKTLSELNEIAVTLGLTRSKSKKAALKKIENA